MSAVYSNEVANFAQREILRRKRRPMWAKPCCLTPETPHVAARGSPVHAADTYGKSAQYAYHESFGHHERLFGRPGRSPKRRRPFINWTPIRARPLSR